MSARMSARRRIDQYMFHKERSGAHKDVLTWRGGRFLDECSPRGTYQIGDTFSNGALNDNEVLEDAISRDRESSIRGLI